MALHQLLNNFTGGELTPQLDARIDLQKYNTGCKRLENMRIRPYGGASFRAGTLYIAAAKHADRECRLISFTVSTSISYVIEMGHQYMRFYRDGAQITSGPSAYEIATVFQESELFEIQFKQINDVMYLVHPSRPPQKLSRASDTSWTIETVAWTYPPLLDENSDEAKTLRIDTTTAGAFIIGGFYRIVSIGTTDFTLIGAAANTVGIVFEATGAGVGTGTAFQLGGGGATLVANFDIFEAGHVFSAFELRHVRDATKTELDLSVTTPGITTSGEIDVRGEWTFVTTERWYGRVYLERSYDGGTTWEKVRVFTSASDRNASASGTQTETARFRIKFDCEGDPYASPPWTGTAPTTFVAARATFEVASTFIAGLVSITAVTDARHATVFIGQTVENETATALWSEGAWSTKRGFPRTVGLFEQRLFFGGTSYKPNTVWGSATADLENFQYGDTDDAAVAYQIAAAQQNPVNWLETLERLWLGTAGGEHYLSSGNENEPLTPSNVIVRDPSAYASEFVQALKVDKALLFVQRQGKRLRELKEDQDPDKSNDLTALAEHLMSEGFVQLAYARLPEPYLYAVMANGQMAVMAYMPEQNVYGWSRYITANNGVFESVAAVPGTPSDVVYVVVRRTINGATVRYVEVFTAETSVPFSWLHMDCAKTYVGPLSTVTGLSHLEGQQVQVVGGASGAVISDVQSGVGVLTVSGGSITLPASLQFVRVGLYYPGRILPMTLDAGLSNGTSQGRKKRIKELVLRFRDTLGARYGTGPNSTYNRNLALDFQMAEIPFRSTEDNMDEAPSLFTGDIPVPWEGGAEFADAMQISQTQPLPFTLLGIFAKLEVFGD